MRLGGRAAHIGARPEHLGPHGEPVQEIPGKTADGGCHKCIEGQEIEIELWRRPSSAEDIAEEAINPALAQDDDPDDAERAGDEPKYVGETRQGCEDNP